MTRFLIGQNHSNAKGQHDINPKLQRTQASGSASGIELGTQIPVFPVIQNGLVTLKNRKMPLNLASTPNKKRVVKNDLPSLQGTPKRRGL